MIDDIDRQLLLALQDDARLTYAELGRRVGLSAPATTERVRRLEASGVITGYHASVDLKAAGLGIVAFVRLSAPAELIAQLERLAQDTPEVLELHRVTGSEGHILKVAVESIEHLDRVVRTFLPYGLTTTSIVLSSGLTRRRIDFGR